jgi:hypothetical protein
MKKNKEKKEDIDLETKKSTPEPVFEIHRMPKEYKHGRFGEKSKEGLKEEKTTPANKSKTKKAGMLIIAFGSLLVIFLAYIIFSYIRNPDFSMADLFTSAEKIVLEEEDEAISTPPLAEEDPIIEDDDIIEDEDDLFDEEPIFEEDVSEEDLVVEDIIFSFVDSDGDGLGDEEEALLGTDPFNPDTDGDGFDDLTEVLNLYDPAGPGSLEENENIDRYKNYTFGYSLLYPNSWEKNVLSDETSVMFLINNNSFVQVLVEANENNQSIENWYSSRFFRSPGAGLIRENSDWRGVFSEDGLAFYITDSGLENIYTFIYSTPENRPILFPNIFNMMINSFEIN